MAAFRFNEKYLSQIPALQLLANVGYKVLSPGQALDFRGGRIANVLLESVLQEQLQKLNRIHYKGGEYPFFEANIQEAIQKLKNVRHDGLQKTNEAIYDLITLGTALEQTIDGNRKSFTLKYIDWGTPGNNVFHVASEFAVERSHSTETARPDVVLFVNGIPLAVIECKAPGVEIEQAVSQSIRNQGDEYIPKLFTYAQLVMGVNKNDARYATAGTKAKFWSVWKELEDEEDEVASIVNRPLSNEQKDVLFSGEFASARRYFDELEENGKRIPTRQDRVLYSLCRPERLLDLAYRFTLFESGEKKIARYQQFFVVRETMARIRRRASEGERAGGIIWQTQGSGKSLTMVMLARTLALNEEIANPRIILVTDRDDLDKQLGNTFTECALSKERATSGRNLVKHLKDKVGIITTLIHKFDKAWAASQYVDESPDIFALVDESHRTNFGELAARMRQMLPNACFLGFTGTPLLKEEKNSFTRFGELIEPHYSIKQAVDDKAVVPLLYEGRHVEMKQNQEAIDLWFGRHTEDLTQEQQADLKRKYARAEALNEADQVIHMRAFDVSEHYRKNWKKTELKAQLVAPSKVAALKYHQHLKDIGYVSSEVVISPPDTREGHEEVNEGPADAVGQFWQKMMKRFGSEQEYTKQIINQFKNGDEPEILIVVDKLLTGFDAPRNTVLYLCRPLREHTLLQAIARVNRLHEYKDYGYVVDYVSVLGELDKALNMYEAFEGFDAEDLAGTLTAISEEVKKLPQRYSDLWDVFREVENQRDEEAFEMLLADDELRQDFYERLAQYGKTLGIALSTDKFVMETSKADLQMYKGDLKRFLNLKKSVKLRYADGVDYRDYEPKIKKLLDTHIQANTAYQMNEPVNIFDEQAVSIIMEESVQYETSGRSPAAKADTIAHAVKKFIREKMDEDPAFYRKFSTLIQQVIDDFKAKRITAMQYLDRAKQVRDSVVSGQRDDVPDSIKKNDEACAYYGAAKDYFGEEGLAVEDEVVASMAVCFQKAFEDEAVVDFWSNEVAQNKVKGRMDDFFYEELKDRHGIELQPSQMDELINQTMQIARSRKK